MAPKQAPPDDSDDDSDEKDWARLERLIEEKTAGAFQKFLESVDKDEENADDAKTKDDAGTGDAGDDSERRTDDQPRGGFLSRFLG